MKASLLWVDLEMTGLDPAHDRILEAAAIATDWNFREIATLEAVVKVDPEIIAERMVGEFWAKNPQSFQQLTAQNSSGESAAAVEEKLLDFLDQNFAKAKPIYLAGNSIHQDRRFIAREWPRLDARLHYRMLDVSSYKIVFENKFDVHFAKPEAHRALSDIRGSIDELKFYLEKFARK
ncbi:MAG: oligoribonuclease [Candidatus Nomurabacteria bacterium]|jgi:oligoribonuclease|nr:oligoribonuclease [Candidatus Nomurabacteria bacterium]